MRLEERLLEEKRLELLAELYTSNDENRIRKLKQDILNVENQLASLRLLFYKSGGNQQWVD